MRLPSPPRTVVVLGQYRDAENQGACPSVRRCFLILSFTVINTVPGTHTVLYCVLCFSCPAARRQRRLPSLPRTVAPP